MSDVETTCDRGRSALFSARVLGDDRIDGEDGEVGVVIQDMDVVERLKTNYLGHGASSSRSEPTNKYLVELR